MTARASSYSIYDCGYAKDAESQGIVVQTVIEWIGYAQCAQTAEWLGTAKRSIRPHDKMFTIKHFPDDALGLLASDNGVIGAPRWRFMRQSHQVPCLTESGLHRLTRAQRLHHLSRLEIATIFDEVWTSVYVVRHVAYRWCQPRTIRSILYVEI